jgi:type I restriction enzyme R subunit
MPIDPYTEHADAHGPALTLLQKIGYDKITPGEAKDLRDGDTSTALLTEVLDEKLRELNDIEYKGETYAFSDASIDRAIRRLQKLPESDLLQANEKAYERLTLGVSIEQAVEGDTKSHPLHYVDWDNPENNAYHVATEPVYARRGGKTHDEDDGGSTTTRRPDLVLYVNGIPFVVIEFKRRDEELSVEAGIKQMRRNQKSDEIPQLFYYAQLLVAAQPNEVRYGTTRTEREFWTLWREEELDADEALESLLSSAGPQGNGRLPREQDRVLWALCRPERLLRLSYRYVVFDAGDKKIARYQQYFAVEKILGRVQQRNEKGQRKGGVVWHTQGSGKSLTMVFLAKALATTGHVRAPRVLLVTDRTSLDEQLWKTFEHCGMEPTRARTGTHLADLIEDPRERVVTTVVNKFKTACESRSGLRNENENIFVLVDEGHRTQYGLLHAKMRTALPNACYIGFTGTPLTKEEKNTARKFGGIIDEYTIDQAVEDDAIVPLLYESRHPDQDVQDAPLDDAFDRMTRGAGEEQQADLKRKATEKHRLRTTEESLRRVAYDIADHYVENWQGTGLKAQVAVPGKADAVRMHRYFEEDDRVNTAVVISRPDQPESPADLEEDDRKAVVKSFWEDTVQPFGGLDNYKRRVLTEFGEEGGIEILIVVRMLLTGFDEPRNTVLYVNRSLREHRLLQAIARVNRLHEEKDFGYVLDYWGILDELDKALTSYDALSGYDDADLQDAIHSVREEVDQLPSHHTNVWELFDPVIPERQREKVDVEAMERYLEPDNRRHKFYERLAKFSSTLQSALSTQYFHENTPDDRVTRYSEDAKFFQKMRRSVRIRYAERIDFDKYDNRVRKLLDRYVSAEEVEQITEPVNIFDREDFAEEVERVTGSASTGADPTASKADAIAHRVKRRANERMDEDPALYKKLSEMVQEAIASFREERIDEMEYFNRVRDLEEQLEDGVSAGMPRRLEGRPAARAYYGIVDEKVSNDSTENELPDLSQEQLANAGIRIEEIIDKHKVVDWTRNPDVEKRMRNEVEDYLYFELGFPLDSIQEVLDRVIQVARSRD